MESYQVLEEAIPKLRSEKVAKLLGVTADYVRRWRREPESDESPNASGQRSILDRICDLIDVVYLINPSGSALIVNFVNAHYDSLLRTHASPISTREAQAATGAELLVQATEAINALHLEGVTLNTHRELVELRHAADVAIKQIEKTLEEQQQ